MPTSQPERATYSVPEVATILGVTRSAVYDAVKRGELAHIRFGKRVLVPKYVVDALLGKGATPKPRYVLTKV